MYEMFIKAIKEAGTIGKLKSILREVNACEALKGRSRESILIQMAHEKMKTIPLETIIRELAEHLL